MRPDYTEDSEYHRKRRVLLANTTKCLVSAMTCLGAPVSLLDVGCGEGKHLTGSTVLDVVGVDLAAPDTAGFVRHDLTTPLNLGRVFDWVICWEVAEHLPEHAAGVLCDTLARHVSKPEGRLLFSAAPPGQRGPGHIHLQPPAYWREQCWMRGLELQATETAVVRSAWRAAAPTSPWYAKNLMIYAWA